jgi:NosR/NirI family nitrous oxide reductase transcriptional regulator
VSWFALLWFAAAAVADPGDDVPSRVGGRDSVPERGSLECEERDPCADVLPGASRFERPEGRPYAVGYNDAGARVGWVVLSNDVVDVKGYSGKPLSTLVGLTESGAISGARVVHHGEPILLVGIPEGALADFVDQYVGVPATAQVVVGESDEAAVAVHSVSGATVTVLAQNQTLLGAARALGADVGVITVDVARPGAFVQDEPWSWDRMVREEALGHLVVEQAEMGGSGDRPFLDLWFGLADAPQVGVPLLGEHVWRRAKEALQPGEHLFVAFNAGTTSYKGSGFVRGGIFDRFRLEQGLRVQTFHDHDYTNLGAARIEGAPQFTEAGLFVTRDASLDPGEPYRLIFLASQYDTSAGAFHRDFRSFEVEHRTPDSVYQVEGWSAAAELVFSTWKAKPLKLVAVAGWLSMIAGLFVGRRWLTGNLARLKRIHVGVMAGSFVLLGLVLQVQPSITQLLTILGSVVGEWRWSLFLSDPFLFVSWIFIASVLFVWGRGVFCGWACPYGAMSELSFKLGRKLGLPEIELPLAIHRRARLVRYGILLTLVATFLVDAQTGEIAAEIEPFKSTFYVPPWTRHPLLFGWWIALFASSFVTWRPFCQYLCPLGASLAIPSYFRVSGPRRRDFCTNCKICTRTCEPRAIGPTGIINGADCLNCMECEANYWDHDVCPPLIKEKRTRAKGAAAVKGSA